MSEAMIQTLATAAKDEVTARFTNAETWVADATAALTTAITALTTALNQTTLPKPGDIKYDFTDKVTVAPFPATAIPLPANLTWAPTATFPAAFTETFNPSANIGNAPTLRQEFPTITIPDAPISTMPKEPGSPPTMPDHAFPVEPSPVWPTAPTVKDISIPGVPDIPYPTWDGEKVTISLSPPDLSFSWSEPGYSSSVKQALINNIVNVLTNGGTGLGADAEAALWERMRGRKDLLNERAYREAESYFAARGHILPPGALAGRLQEALAEQNRADEDLNADITFKQAELAYQATQAAIASGIQFEAEAWQAWNAAVTRAFEGQKFTIESAIQLFNAKVQYHNLQLDKYKTEAAVYQQLMQGALARLEAYKAELQGKQIAAEIQKLAVDTYTAQLQGVTLLYEVYKTRLSAIQLKVEIDKLNLDAFKLSIDIYVARIQAKTAEFNLYESKIKGEMAKVQVYSEAVRAYGVEMDGYKTRAAAKEAEISALSDAYKARAAAANSAVDAYRSAMAAEGEKVQAGAKQYEADVEKYKADSMVVNSNNEIEIKRYMTSLESAKNELMALVEKVKADVQVYTAQAGFAIEAAKTVATAAAQRLASALQGVSATASIAGHAQYGISSTYHRDETETTGGATSGKGNYSYSSAHSYKEK